MGSYKPPHVPFTLEWKKSTEKDLHRISPGEVPTIVQKAEELRRNPFPPGVQKIKRAETLYRIRAGDYRILYQIDVKKRTITIHYVRHRKIAYRGL